MKQVFGIVMLCLFTFGLSAQDGVKRKGRKEVIEAKKIAFITEELDLSPSEAEKFWPIYNQREDEIKAVRKELKPDFNKGEFDSLSDEEVEEMLYNGLEMKEKELEIERKYLEEFKEVISVKQIARLHHAERQFKLELIKKIRGGEGMKERPGRR